MNASTITQKDVAIARGKAAIDDLALNASLPLRFRSASLTLHLADGESVTVAYREVTVPCTSPQQPCPFGGKHSGYEWLVNDAVIESVDIDADMLPVHT